MISISGGSKYESEFRTVTCPSDLYMNIYMNISVVRGNLGGGCFRLHLYIYTVCGSSRSTFTHNDIITEIKINEK